MAAKVRPIDKLRVQGNAAPKHVVTEHRRTVGYRPGDGFHDLDGPTHHFVMQPPAHMAGVGPKEGGARSGVNSTPSSAASRRQDYLQRVQHANRGLTSADYRDSKHLNTNNNNAIAVVSGANSNNNSCYQSKSFGSHQSPSLPNIQFLLRGKTVSGEYEFTPYNIQAHQRVGHYKTSAKEVYRARHKAPADPTLFWESREYGNFYRSVRSAEHESVSSVHTQEKPAFFYLGPPMSAPVKKSISGHNARLPPAPTNQQVCEEESARKRRTGGGGVWEQGDEKLRTADHTKLSAGDHLALTGQQMQTPRMAAETDACTGNDDYMSHRYPGAASDMNFHSAPTPTSRRRQQRIRNSSRESMAFPPDLALLNQCLQVQQSQHKSPASDISPRAMARLRHFTQYVRKDEKINYNNPYRNFRARERKALTKNGRYVFNSVDSYIHFNKIYPRLENPELKTSSINKTPTKPAKVPNIPQLDGFSTHCTDTVLLKMMFEMNRPKSIKSVSKYSDVAVHKDLDEFMVVGTPSVSRSPSVISRKLTGRKTKSLSSYVGTGTRGTDEDGDETAVGKEVIEEKHEPVSEKAASTVRDDVTRDESPEPVEPLHDDAIDTNDVKDDNSVDEVKQTGRRDEDAKSESYLDEMKKEQEGGGEEGGGGGEQETPPDPERSERQECYSSSSESTGYVIDTVRTKDTLRGDGTDSIETPMPV